MSEWVLRLDSGGWWSGKGQEATPHPLDAASFADPGSCRRAMAAAGWHADGDRPGWIEPLRAALARNAPVQLDLSL